MGMAIGSIAATSAISITVLEAAMDKKEFHREAAFQLTMHLARKMLYEKLITKKEFRDFEKQMMNQYDPLFTCYSGASE
jgi:hypothetical protein